MCLQRRKKNNKIRIDWVVVVFFLKKEQRCLNNSLNHYISTFCGAFVSEESIH